MLFRSICVLFSGCSFRIASSVDDLIAPVAPSGENENVQNALNSFCKDGFSLPEWEHHPAMKHSAAHRRHCAVDDIKQ